MGAVSEVHQEQAVAPRLTATWAIAAAGHYRGGIDPSSEVSKCKKSAL